MTGNHTESHGMIANYMYDPTHNRSFDIGENEDQYSAYWWDQAEPFWITLTKMGYKTFMYFWPGCEVEIRGTRPTFCTSVQKLNYSHRPEAETMDSTHAAVTQGMELLANGSADFVGLYYPLIDEFGHCDGPDSANLIGPMDAFDRGILKFILDEIKHKNLEKELDFVMFSDHGMANVYPENVANTTQFLNSSDVDNIIRTKEHGNIMHLWTTEDAQEQIYTKLKGMENATIYKKAEIPARWHYRNNDRIAPLLMVANPEYFIINPLNPKPFPKMNNTVCSGDFLKGMHGYDNEDKDMHGIFMGVGPHFKPGSNIEEIHAVDIYQILCKIMNISALPNQGDWQKVAPLWRDPPVPPAEESGSGGATAAAIIIIVLLIVVAVIVAFYLRRRKLQSRREEHTALQDNKDIFYNTDLNEDPEL